MCPRLELILIRERSFITPRSRRNVTTFGKGEGAPGVQNSFKIELRAPNSRWPWLKAWPRTTPFLLALHTNLAADAAKLDVCVARTQGGTLKLAQAVSGTLAGYAA